MFHFSNMLWTNNYLTASIEYKDHCFNVAKKDGGTFWRIADQLNDDNHVHAKYLQEGLESLTTYLDEHYAEKI